MAAPSSYSETGLADYMHTVLGPVATALAYTSPASYVEAVNEALLDYGTDDISTVSGRDNIRKLRALAMVQVWRMVVQQLSTDYDFSAGNSTFNRSQMQKQAAEALSRAEQTAMTLGATPGYVVGIDTITHIHDPYRYVPDDERVIP